MTPTADEIAAQVLALVAAGRGGEAYPLAAAALQRMPEALPLWNAFAVTLIVTGQAEEAGRVLSVCVSTLPGDGDFIANLGNAFLATRRHKSAATWFRRAIALGARDEGTLTGLGIALDATEEFGAAMAAFAAALDHAPGSQVALLGYGHAAHGRGNAAIAIVPLRRAAALAPAHADIWKTLAAALLALDDHAGAVAAGRRSLASGSADPKLFASLAIAFVLQQRVSEGLGLARRGLAIDPGATAAWEAIGNALLYAGEVGEARTSFSRSLTVDPAQPKCRSNLLFALAYDATLSNRTLFAAYRDWERRHALPLYPTAEPPLPSRGDRPIKIGYVSTEFRDHPIAQLSAGLFTHHDRGRFEVHGYAGVDKPDHVTRRLAAAADGWHSIVGLSDAEASARIRADGIDVLVMLGAHTGRNRPLILALKPAPVQAVMHDLSTSGMRTVDAWLTDAVLHPADTTEGHTEELVRLPSLYLHRMPDPSPEVSPLPCASAGFVTFGSFSTPAKLNDRVLDLWSRILAAVPGSRLMVGHNAAFGDPLIAARFRRRCAVAGIAAERVDLVADRVGRDAHLARVGRLDIALDPFPFNGGITTFEALWMGVPVVTLDGPRFAARGCASHLAQVGLYRQIAPTEDAYVAEAVRLAGSPAELAEIRGSLRERVRTSRLCDAPAYVLALEEALGDLWSRRTAGAASMLGPGI